MSKNGLSVRRALRKVAVSTLSLFALLSLARKASTTTMPCLSRETLVVRANLKGSRNCPFKTRRPHLPLLIGETTIRRPNRYLFQVKTNKGKPWLNIHSIVTKTKTRRSAILLKGLAPKSSTTLIKAYRKRWILLIPSDPRSFVSLKYLTVYSFLFEIFVNW